MDDEVKRRWGTNEQYYKELEAFHEQHKNADAIVYDNEMKCPTQAVYHFRPYTVVVDHYRLMQRLAEEDIKRSEDND